VTWGTPIPSTSRVVHAAPGPTPTNTAAAPWRISSIAAWYEVVLPTATGIRIWAAKSLNASGSYPAARCRADETCDWTRKMSAPASAATGPKRRAAAGVAATNAGEPASWISPIR
jgi:hypothetical protein